MSAAARFVPGTRVRVRIATPRTHCRTPCYVRGREGVIIRHAGDFPDPERRAYHHPGLPAIPLYHVRFEQTALWPDARPGDTLALDLYGHWLEPVGT